MSGKPVSSIRNLGPKSDAGFARAGISTAEALIELGPDEAYYKYLTSGGTAHFIGYYCIVLGLQGRPWNDAQPEEKAELRVRFDAIKARAKATNAPSPETAIESELDALGVGLNRN